MFLKILQNSQENTCVGGSFQLIKNRACDTGVFLWIFAQLLKHLFYKTPPGDCFSNTIIKKIKYPDKKISTISTYFLQIQTLIRF